MSYAWEKLFTAVNYLVSHQPIRTRMLNAYGEVSPLKVDDVPREILEDYNKYRSTLTREKPLGEEGSVQATLNKLSDEEINDLAELVVSMFAKVAELEVTEKIK